MQPAAPSRSLLLMFITAVAAMSPWAMARAEGEGETVYKRLLRSTVWIVVPESRVIDKVNLTSRVRFTSGSGSLIDANRKMVLTNYHVVGGRDEVYVIFPVYRDGKLIADRDAYMGMLRDSKTIRARVKVADKTRDLALLELDSVPPGAQALKLARESASPGQRVHSVGNRGAGGALWAYTFGTVSSAPYRKTFRSGGREGGPFLEIEAYVIETQSPTNPGDSGGPLVNDRGELIAVTQGGVREAQNVSLFIDVREVTGLLANAKIRPQFASGRGDDKPKPDSSPAAKAKTDPAADAAKNAEKLAKNKLDFAKVFYESRKISDAQEYCEQVIERYPQTKAATEAKELLEKIKKKK